METLNAQVFEWTHQSHRDVWVQEDQVLQEDQDIQEDQVFQDVQQSEVN